jgi:hypothetical protein
MTNMAKSDLIVREAHLSDIVDSLQQERRFALETQDWPRKREVEHSLKLANERLLTVSLKLAVMA